MKKILGLMVGVLLMSVNLYAGNGDLIVNGNLGVGTATPTAGYKLAVESPWAGTLLRSTAPTGYTSLRLLNDQNQALRSLEIDYAGSSYSGSLLWGGPTGESASITTSGAYSLVFGTSNSARMIITGDGNVGIGTINPGGSKLYVNGNFTVNGSPFSSDPVWHLSDIKFKKDIQALDSPLDKILKIKGVSYNFRTDEFKEKNFSEGRHYGLIAQEIEKVLPEVVKEDEDGNKAVAYTEIIPVLIEAMKEQQKQIMVQQEEIKGQQMRIEELEKKVAQLK